jgi:putative N6-adenine-specific DNA methylase
VDWSEWLTARHTLAVRASCKSSALTHSQFIAQRTKDAVVDQLREKTGSRPSVDRDDPDVLLFVHLVRDRASLYIDVSGESMHRRGYRTRIEDAPLKETLAASIVRLSGWDRKLPFVDPMCGSGTIAIEAALWAQDIAPGLLRGENGFERWASYDDTAKNTLRELLERAKANVKKDAPSILACDVSLDALATTRDNARRAGVSIRVARRSVGSIEPTNPPGFVVTNPPYGERLEGAPQLYREMGDAFRRLSRHRITVLSGSAELERAIRLKPSRMLIVFNGPIECRLLNYEVR